MSYSVIVGDQSFDYTWNLSDFFYAMIPGVEGAPTRQKGGIGAIACLTGREAFEILADAFETFERKRIDLSTTTAPGEVILCGRYDSPNGWGSVVGAMSFMARIMAACAKNPDAIVEVF